MKRLLFGSALLLLLSSASAFAQQTTGNITGRVVDQQGAAIPGASITAKNPATGLTRTETSDAEGVYRVAALPVGIYEVVAELTGFATISKQDIEVNVGQQRVCWQITVNNITAPMRGHIHKGPAGGAGGIVVPFFEPSNVNLNGCTSTKQPVDRRLLMDIIQHPQDYYVNVHNADFPGGAIRGQLKK